MGSQAVSFISLFDDTLDVWSSNIISQVEDLSDVAFWSEPDHFMEMLTETEQN